MKNIKLYLTEEPPANDPFMDTITTLLYSCTIALFITGLISIAMLIYASKF